jgi:type II secretory pathway component PulM
MRWEPKTAREKWIAYIGGGLVVFYILFFWIYGGWQRFLAGQETVYREKQALYARIQEIDKQYGHHKGLNIIGSERMLSVLSESLKTGALGGFVYTLEQTNAGDIHLAYAAVPYPLFMKWLWDMNGQYKFSIIRLHMTRGEKPGVVKVDMVISHTP